MDINSYINNDIIFDIKASAVPYNYRISYKIAQLCLIISKSCSSREGCSLVKLHIISNGLNTDKNMRELEAKDELFTLIDNPFITETTIIRFDPAISRAINLAMADTVIFRQSNGLYRLKDKGKALLNAIYTDDTILAVEKRLLSELSNKLTEEIIERIASNWRLG